MSGTHPDDAATAFSVNDGAVHLYQPGLTKREYMALHIMAGMCAATRPDEGVAERAVWAADMLIEELNNL